MHDIGDRLDAIYNALSAGGLTRGVIPESRKELEEDNDMDDGDGVSDPLALLISRVHGQSYQKRRKIDVLSFFLFLLAFLVLLGFLFLSFCFRVLV
jgi:hypothetical protein